MLLKSLITVEPLRISFAFDEYTKIAYASPPLPPPQLPNKIYPFKLIVRVMSFLISILASLFIITSFVRFTVILSPAAAFEIAEIISLVSSASISTFAAIALTLKHNIKANEKISIKYSFFIFSP